MAPSQFPLTKTPCTSGRHDVPITRSATTSTRDQSGSILEYDFDLDGSYIQIEYLTEKDLSFLEVQLNTISTMTMWLVPPSLANSLTSNMMHPAIGLTIIRIYVISTPLPEVSSPFTKSTY